MRDMGWLSAGLETGGSEEEVRSMRREALGCLRGSNMTAYVAEVTLVYFT